MTTKPRHPLPTIEWSIGHPSEDQLWEAADIPPNERDQWRQAYQAMGPGGGATSPARAARLSAYGWTAGDLSNALRDLRVCFPPPAISAAAQKQGHTPESLMTPEQVEAYTVLTDEALTYFENRYEAAKFRRVRYMDQLATFRWNHQEIGKLVGLSKQRVQQLLKHLRNTETPKRGPFGSFAK